MATPVRQTGIHWLQQAHPMAPEFVCDTCGVTYAETTTEAERQYVALQQLIVEPVRHTRVVALCRECGIVWLANRTVAQSDDEAPLLSEIIAEIHCKVGLDPTPP